MSGEIQPGSDGGIKMKRYEIMGSHLIEGGKWGANETCHVVAATAQRAVELVMVRYPDLEIWSLHNKGRVDIIEDRP